MANYLLQLAKCESGNNLSIKGSHLTFHYTKSTSEKKKIKGTIRYARLLCDSGILSGHLFNIEICYIYSHSEELRRVELARLNYADICSVEYHLQAFEL